MWFLLSNSNSFTAMISKCFSQTHLDLFRVFYFWVICQCFPKVVSSQGGTMLLTCHDPDMVGKLCVKKRHLEDHFYILRIKKNMTYFRTSLQVTINHKMLMSNGLFSFICIFLARYWDDNWQELVESNSQVWYKRIVYRFDQKICLCCGRDMSECRSWCNWTKLWSWIRLCQLCRQVRSSFACVIVFRIVCIQ